MYDMDLQAVRDAERVVVLAKWRYLEEAALARLARQQGLARTPLHPPCWVIQFVAEDGDYLGKIRLADPHSRQQRWIAVPKDCTRPLGGYRSARAAGQALRAHRRAGDRRQMRNHRGS